MKKILIPILLSLWPIVVEADVSTKCDTLLNVTNGSASANGTSQYVSKLTAKAFLGQLIATDNGGVTPTLDVKIQHSLDGTNWYDYITFTQVTTGSNNTEAIAPSNETGHIFPYVRAVSTMGGSGLNYTYTTKLCYQ